VTATRRARIPFRQELAHEVKDVAQVRVEIRRCRNAGVRPVASYPERRHEHRLHLRGSGTSGNLQQVMEHHCQPFVLELLVRLVVRRMASGLAHQRLIRFAEQVQLCVLLEADDDLVAEAPRVIGPGQIGLRLERPRVCRGIGQLPEQARDQDVFERHIAGEEDLLHLIDHRRGRRKFATHLFPGRLQVCAGLGMIDRHFAHGLLGVSCRIMVSGVQGLVYSPSACQS
jgi:hypothetical protein